MWNNIIRSDLREVLVAKEYDRVIVSVNVENVIGIVVDQFRLSIGASGKYALAATGIPDGLKTSALDVIANRLLILVGAPDADRKTAADKAEKLLESIAAGDYAVESPSTGTAQQPSPKFSKKPGVVKRYQENGL